MVNDDAKVAEISFRLFVHSSCVFLFCLNIEKKVSSMHRRARKHNSHDEVHCPSIEFCRVIILSSTM